MEWAIQAVERGRRHRCVLCSAEEAQIHTLRDDRRHVGVGNRGSPGFSTIDQALFQAVKGLFPGNRNRVQVQRLHGDAAKLGARHAVFRAGELLNRCDRVFVFPCQTKLNATQLRMAEEEFQAMHFLKRITQDALRCGRVHEVVLVRARTEHVGVVQHVQVRRTAG